MEVQPKAVQHARDLVQEYPAEVARLVLPGLSKDEEKKIIELIGKKDKLYISISRQVPEIGSENWHQVGERNGFSVWQLQIRSPEAMSVRAWFSGFELSGGMSVKVYGLKEGDTHVKEYTGKGFADAMDFWSLLIPGDTLVVEVWTPSSNGLSPADFPFGVSHLDHHFRDSVDNIQPLESHSKNIPQSRHSTCSFENDLCAFPDNAERGRGVARIVYTPPPGQGSSTQCTGGLLVTASQQDEGVYMLTAYHCIDEGSHPEMPQGTLLNINIAIGVSDCVPQNQRITGQGARFIAGHERGDYALLWVSRSDLTSPTPSPVFLMGWSSESLPTGSIIEKLHHARGTDQNYAQVRISGLSHHNLGDIFSPCVNPSGCSHYRIHYETGGLEPGASGSLLWRRQGTLVAGVTTHRDDDVTLCEGWVSRMSKIFEDGRVECALTQGDAYYPDGISNCDSSSRPAYSNRSPASPSGIHCIRRRSD